MSIPGPRLPPYDAEMDGSLLVWTAPVLKRYVYRVHGDRRTFVVYAVDPILAIELIETANLNLPVEPLGLTEESEEDGRAWERSACASIVEGFKK